VILRQPRIVEQLLHDGADPTAKLWWEDGQFWGPTTTPNPEKITGCTEEPLPSVECDVSVDVEAPSCEVSLDVGCEVSLDVTAPSCEVSLDVEWTNPLDVDLDGQFWGPSTAAERYTVLDLAQNSLCPSAQNDWSTEVCLETVQLVQRSLSWSRNDAKAHYLFPPQFRRAVRHILGLKVALDRMEPAITFSNMSESLWLMVIEHIDRDDDHWFDCELTSD